jgi:hypothetical protein
MRRREAATVYNATVEGGRQDGLSGVGLQFLM